MLCFYCVVAICVLCFSLAASWVVLQSVVVAFPGHILTCFVNWRVLLALFIFGTQIVFGVSKKTKVTV